MEKFIFHLRTYLQKLDKADGEAEIASAMSLIYQYIQALPADQQPRANQELDYYITKRVAKIEEKIELLSYEFRIAV